MTFDRTRSYLQLFRGLDLIVIAVAFLLSILIVQSSFVTLKFAKIVSLQLASREIILLSLFLVIWAAVLSGSPLYRSRRLSTIRSEICDVLRVAGVSAGFTLFVGYAAASDVIAPRQSAVFFALSCVLILSYRLAARALAIQIRARGRNIRHILLVGTGPRAMDFVRLVHTRPSLGYRIDGFVDDDWPGATEVRSMGYSVVCNLESFADYVASHIVDEVVIGLPLATYYLQAWRIVALCEEQGILIRCLSEFFPTKLTRVRTEEVDGTSVTTFYPRMFEDLPLAVKRGIDIFVSAVLLLCLAPLFIVVALLITLTSPGPVFFVQERAGLNRRPFRIYKFRSMVQDADKLLETVVHLNQENGAAFKIKNDPRITPLGSLLRRTSIDELPQLINILVGDMSLVGPRPLFSWEFERINTVSVKRRFSIRPGLTGLWQVSGRSNVTFDHRVKMDLYYIDNWSLRLDWELLLKTIPVVFTGRGAV